jgi:hypothetical protein
LQIRVQLHGLALEAGSFGETDQLSWMQGGGHDRRESTRCRRVFHGGQTGEHKTHHRGRGRGRWQIVHCLRQGRDGISKPLRRSLTPIASSQGRPTRRTDFAACRLAAGGQIRRSKRAANVQYLAIHSHAVLCSMNAIPKAKKAFPFSISRRIGPLRRRTPGFAGNCRAVHV